MKLCDINGLYSESGGGIRTYHLHKIEYFRRSGRHRYAFVFPSDRNSIETDGQETLVRIRGVSVPGMPQYRLFFDIHRLRAFFETFRPDLVEIGSPYLEPVSVPLALRGRACAVTGFWHAHYPVTYAGHVASKLHPAFGTLAERAAWRYARATYGSYDAVFASAESVVRSLRDHGIRRVLMTPLGVETDRFHPDRRDEGLRTGVGAVNGRPLLFFPHRLQDEKGLYTLLEALPEIIRELDPVVAFAGAGPGLQKLEDFMRRHRSVRYLGHVKDPDELARWYASADAVFALSPYETFGLSVAESLSSGTPVIGADAGGAEELIRRSGGGITVQTGDPAALASAVITLMKSGSAPRYGRAGRVYAEANFGWNTVFDRLTVYYELILEARRSGTRIGPEPSFWDHERGRLVPV